jgi:hypothetical protein
MTKLQLSYRIGRRFIVATFAAFLMTFSVVSIKFNDDGTRTLLEIHDREKPNLFIGATALYLLGFATDFNLVLPLLLLKGQMPSKDDKS